MGSSRSNIPRFPARGKFPISHVVGNMPKSSSDFIVEVRKQGTAWGSAGNQRAVTSGKNCCDSDPWSPLPRGPGSAPAHLDWEGKQNYLVPCL